MDNHHNFAGRLSFVNREREHSHFDLSTGRELRYSKCRLGNFTVSVCIREHYAAYETTPQYGIFYLRGFQPTTKIIGSQSGRLWRELWRSSSSFSPC